MKLPARDEVAEVLAKDLAPCQNEHVAHLEETHPPSFAWIDCGSESLAKLAVSEATDRDAISQFFEVTMARHSAHAWRAIAQMLLS